MAKESAGRDQLIELLKKHTQQAVAATVGVKQQTVSDWANGETQPRGENAVTVEREYGIKMPDWYRLPDRLAPKPARRPPTRGTAAVEPIKRAG